MSGFAPKQYFLMDRFIRVAKKGTQVKMTSFHHKICTRYFLLCFYQGGETVSICYSNRNQNKGVNNSFQYEYIISVDFLFSANPLKCLCSRPLCNSSGSVTIIRQLQHPGRLSYFICLLLFMNKVYL